MKKIAAVLIAVSMISFLGCNNAPKSEDDLKKGYMGTFAGVIPCADCEGIQIVLELNPNNTVVEYSLYKGTNSGDNIISSAWEASGPDFSVIKIKKGVKGEYDYWQFISKDELRKMDIKGKPITSDLNYSLKRVVRDQKI
ncbi:putative lipoprotein NlpE involved in copper resistance [Elusimicrobium simillimum]|uniref:copper resistance protein NlpE n=1 Tax=Elusimicrobium simillimum TaxID=3143438 RepID=UPI003C6EDD2C